MNKNHYNNVDYPFEELYRNIRLSAYGPWKEEPNFAYIDGGYGSYDRFIKRHYSAGHLCGYIKVTTNNRLCRSPSEKLHGIDVHGGITFSGKLFKFDCWWIGFDCGHSEDLSPFFVTNFLNRIHKTDKTYKTYDYVLRELDHLEEQVREYEYKPT